VADDHPPFGSAIGYTIEEHPDLKAVAEAASAQRARALSCRLASGVRRKRLSEVLRREARKPSTASTASLLVSTKYQQDRDIFDGR
jgi:hypothetical protein